MADIKRAHAFTCDVWRFCKDHFEVKQDDEYWQSVVMDASELVKKYGGSEALKNIILDVIEVLEEKERECQTQEYAVSSSDPMSSTGT